MSREHESRRTTIDETIDRVVASMTSGAPEPDLGRRVAARIENAQGAVRLPALAGPAWRLAMVATTAAVVVAVVTTAIRVSRDVSPPVARIAADHPLDGRPAAGSIEGAAGAGATSAASKGPALQQRPRASAAGASARREPVGRTRQVQNLPLLDPVDVEAIDAPGQLRVAALAPALEPIAPEAIDVEPLTLDRLDQRLAWPPGRHQP